MSDSVIGKGVIEVSADSSKLRTGIDDAKRSIKSLGEANKDASTKASQSIDRYIKKLDEQRKMEGMSTRESELYKLALRGASEAQLKAADSTLRLAEAHKKGSDIGASLRTGFIAAAAASVLAAIAIAASIKNAVDAADHLNDLSKKTGIAVDTLGGLGFAAGQAGGDLESVAAAAGKLNKSIAEAGRGNAEFGEAFNALGINIRDASGDLKKADVVMAEVASKFEGYEDGPEKAAIALKLFGKAGADIIPLLNDGGKALAENVEYYKKYAGVTQDTAGKADEFNDTMGKIHLLSGGLGRTLAADLLPSMQSIAAEMLKAKENGTGIVSFIHSIAGEVNKLVAELVVGTKEAGSFWTAVGLVVTRNPFRSLQDNIKGYRDDLKEAQADLEKFRKAGKDTAPIEASIKRTNARIAITQSAIDSETKDAQGVGRGDPRLFDPDAIAAAEKAKKKDTAPALPGSAGPKGRDTAAQEAKAQLTLELDEIRKGAAAETEIYANLGKILEAQHAATLVDDRQYYQEKLGLIQLNSQAQEAGLLKELERLQAEKLAGKDAIDNDRKILDTKAKLAKVRADAGINVEINGIQEAAANKKVAQSYGDAKAAAEAYLDTVKKQNAREVAGIGKGQRFRDEQAGISQIEDKQTNARREYDGELRRGEITQKQFDAYIAIVNDTYAKEVELYQERTDTIKKLQTDGLNGASEAIQNYLDSAANMAAQTEDLVGNAIHGLEDAFVQFATTGKLSFSDLAKSILADLARIQAKNLIASLLGKDSGGSSLGLLSKLFSGQQYWLQFGGRSSVAGGAGGQYHRWLC